MKFLFLILLCIAPSTFAWELKSKSISVNDDGSVTINAPYNEDSNGDISGEQSHQTVLCNHFGFAKSVTWIPGRSSKKLWSYRYDKSFEKISEKSHAIEWLVCSSNTTNVPTQVSMRYQSRIDNENQTVTLIEPTFGDFAGRILPLSYDQSHYDGICNLYGFDASVSNGVVAGKSKESERKAAISREGSLRGFDENSSDKILSITCAKPLQFRLRNPFDLEQLPGAMSELSQALYPGFASTLKNFSNFIQNTYPIEAWKRGRVLNGNDLTEAHWARVAALYFLEPLFRSYDSEWFTREVKPVYEKRMISVKALSGIQNMAGLSHNDSPVISRVSIQTAIWLIKSTGSAMSGQINEQEKKQWLAEIDLASSRLLQSGISPVEFAKWSTVWLSGETYILELYNNTRLADLTLLFDQVGKWVLSCQQ